MSGPDFSYDVGTISVANGSTTVTGAGEMLWVTNTQRGDKLWALVGDGGSPEFFDLKFVGMVGAVAGNAALTLMRAWRGAPLTDVEYLITREIPWLAGATPNETLVRFLTEMDGKGLVGVSTSTLAPLPDFGREGQLHIDGNGIAYYKKGGLWRTLNAPARYDAYGDMSGSPSERDQYDDGQGDLDDAVGRGLTFFDEATGQWYMLVTVADDGGSPAIEAEWAGPFDAHGSPGPAGRTILTGTGAPTGGDGENGDYYIDTATLTLYGPKAAGAWPAGVVLPGEDGDDGDNAYVYVAWASADDGTGFTMTFDEDLDFIAILSTDTAIETPAAEDFAGLWKKYKGQPGQSIAAMLVHPDDYPDTPLDGVLYLESADAPAGSPEAVSYRLVIVDSEEAYNAITQEPYTLYGHP